MKGRWGALLLLHLVLSSCALWNSWKRFVLVSFDFVRNFSIKHRALVAICSFNTILLAYVAKIFFKLVYGWAILAGPLPCFWLNWSCKILTFASFRSRLIAVFTYVTIKLRIHCWTVYTLPSLTWIYWRRGLQKVITARKVWIYYWIRSCFIVNQLVSFTRDWRAHHRCDIIVLDLIWHCNIIKAIIHDICIHCEAIITCYVGV